MSSTEISMETIIEDEDSFVSNTNAIIYAASDISGWTHSLISDNNIPNSLSSTSVDEHHHQQQQISTAAGGDADPMIESSSASSSWFMNNQQEIRIFNVDFRALCDNRLKSCPGSEFRADTGNGSSGSESLQQLTDQRKRKRMISNRESAIRSRMKKQTHLNELTAKVNQLKEQNNQIVSTITMKSQFYLNVEAENSLLRAQSAELRHRFQSLTEIIKCVNSANETEVNCEDDILNPWDLLHVNQPIMASSDAFMY